MVHIENYTTDRAPAKLSHLPTPWFQSLSNAGPITAYLSPYSRVLIVPLRATSIVRLRNHRDIARIVDIYCCGKYLVVAVQYVTPNDILDYSNHFASTPRIEKLQSIDLGNPYLTTTTLQKRQRNTSTLQLHTFTVKCCFSLIFTQILAVGKKRSPSAFRSEQQPHATKPVMLTSPSGSKQ
ncbi:uncharacterized protein LAJ45_05242 [Morchella importuna]|uniref:uncharacterized protein n=1 Tax=Morchella importuna TaxID=1174673 RepID=UPI001E8EC84B|nr:uncharacterized protein LAJ45_05242 [Morchella importuna]KAH8150546.1 hypothetical protein LAJ45_05242 [Morchella importuna]